MRIHRSAVDIVVQAPAKLNLFFEVLAKRDDGYHEIETLMLPVDLYDTLSFREEPSGQLELKSEWAPGPGDLDGTGLGELPQGRDNLVLRAVELLQKRGHVSSGATLRLVKRIPMAAGLGGGSSDAAAALVAANEGWGLGWRRPELAVLATEVGSDVPFFLADGPAVCRGRGERVEKVDGLPVLHFVVVRPPEGLSTAAVYDACEPAKCPEALSPLLDALIKGDTDGAGRLLFNRLRPAAGRLSPWIERTQEELSRQDVLGHQMSGSGTSYFGLCRHARHARRIARRLQANGVGSVFAVRSCR